MRRRHGALLAAATVVAVALVGGLPSPVASGAASGLVAAYGFEEGSGSTTADASGNGNTGTLVNATWTTAGKFGDALSFNGSNARVDVPDSASLHLTSGMTLEAWVNPALVPNAWHDVIYKGNDNYYLEGSSDSSSKSAGGGTFGGKNANAFAAAALSAGSWSYLAVTYDGTSLRYYVNATLANTTAASGAITTSTNALQIGGDSLWGQYFNGLIDEVRVYNIALTAAQIQTDMTSPVVSGGGDTTAPSAPGALTATASGSSSINLSWGAATDNVGVTGYKIERCQGSGCSSFAQIGTSTSTSFGDTGLTASTSYSYRVRATDAAGNLGPYSNISTATTASSGDTTPPSAPGTLTASAVGASQVNLGWGAATDNVGVTGYKIERCQGSGCSSFAQIGTSTSTSFGDTGLTASTSYSYRVRATDAAGNLGPYSNIATATTGAGGGPTLVAAYGFEEGTGTTTADASGNGNTGTLVNAVWTSTGKFGDALSFNGTNARVTIPDSASLHLSSGMTLEAWVNPASVTSAWRDVIYKPNDNYYLEGTSSSSGNPAGGGTFGGMNANAFASSALPVGSWSYLALTYDGTTLSLYVNGTLAGTAAASGAITTSTSVLQIGGDSLWGQYFNGLIDEVRIYNGALTGAQIQTDMTTPVAGGGGGDTQPPSAPGTLTATAVGSSQINLSWGAATDNVGVTGYRIDRCQGAGCSNFSHLVQLTGTGTSYTDTTVVAATSYSYQVRAFDAAGNIGPTSNVASATTGAATSPTLVAAYGFEEGSGTTTADASGNGHTGTLVNATWTTAGKYGNALSFNGTNARVDIPDAASLHLSSGMTLEAWVDPSVVSSAWRDVVYKGNDNYYLEGTSTKAGTAPAGGGIMGGTYGEADGTSPLPVNSWSYLALTYDGSNVRLYVNGTLVATTAKTGALSASTNPLQIGGDSIYGQYFNGLIDEVRVYSSALSATQIQSDMNTPLLVPTAPTGLNASVASSTEIDLSWGASTDAAGVVGYRVERCQGTNCSNFSQIATPTGTSYQDTGLTANTAYSYRVRAVDANGKTGPYSNAVAGFTGLQVSPHGVALTPGTTQQYTATLSGGGAVSVTWSVDGVTGGSATAGMITAGGLYTAPAAVGKHTITATASGSGQVGSADAYTTNLAGVYTRSYDNMRDGLNANETVLSPTNVNSATFGKLASYALDGVAYAAPLYVSNVAIPGQGTHEIVYVATEHDSIYAFDATGQSSTPFWKDTFINPANGVTTVPAADTGECCDIAPEIGITGTPVIDPTTNTMYVVVKTKEVVGSTTNYVQRLHAIDLSTGAEKFGGPVTITATVPGTGTGSSGGQLPFSPLHENQHTALALVNGVVYFGFASHGDIQPYHGWIFGYNASTLQQTMALCLTPNQEGAGVWMSGGGIAADSTGSLYFITGDGEFDANTGGPDYGDSYIRMTPAGTVADYFSPSNTQAINSSNFDLGSGGALLLPDQPGAHPHEMVSAGKDGAIYLVDRDNMGHFNATTNTNIQTLSNIFPNGNPEPGNFTSPVYYNGTVFFGPLNDTIQGFHLTNGLLSTSPTLRSSEVYPDRGASLSVSAGSPTSNGILWAVQRNGTSAGDLRAYDLTASGSGQLTEIYNSDQAGSRDTLGVAAKFVPPVVANGKVFVAGTAQLTVYGLLP